MPESIDVLRIESLPANALDAAAEFHSRWLPEARELLAAHIKALFIIIPASPYDHDDWRRAAIRDLARDSAPQRVVLIAGSREDSINATLEFVGKSHCITGQYLKLAD